MDKAALIVKIIAQLDDELALYARSARAAHAEATDEQSKAENKYDTRGLEASYLARGQSRQAAETVQARAQFAALPLRQFVVGDAIDLGALVEVEGGGERTVYFIGPSAGGSEITQGDATILVITPHSPLGQVLVKRRKGDRIKIHTGGRSRELHVLSVA